MAPAHPHATWVAVYPALFILLQDSLQFGIVYTGMIQGLNNRKYFIWLFEKNRSFVKICCICDKMLHMQHSDVAYATVRCICDIILRMQHPYVAYTTSCGVCNVVVAHTHAQLNLALTDPSLAEFHI